MATSEASGPIRDGFDCKAFFLERKHTTEARYEREQLEYILDQARQLVGKPFDQLDEAEQGILHEIGDYLLVNHPAVFDDSGRIRWPEYQPEEENENLYRDLRAVALDIQETLYTVEGPLPTLVYDFNEAIALSERRFEYDGSLPRPSHAARVTFMLRHDTTDDFFATGRQSGPVNGLGLFYIAERALEGPGALGSRLEERPILFRRLDALKTRLHEEYRSHTSDPEVAWGLHSMRFQLAGTGGDPRITELAEKISEQTESDTQWLTKHWAHIEFLNAELDAALAGRWPTSVDELNWALAEVSPWSRATWKARGMPSEYFAALDALEPKAREAFAKVRAHSDKGEATPGILVSLNKGVVAASKIEEMDEALHRAVPTRAAPPESPAPKAPSESPAPKAPSESPRPKARPSGSSHRGPLLEA